MDNQHRNEWYGPEATTFKKYKDYNLINYQCEGTGICMDYSLFSGIDLIFMDFNCSHTFREPMVNRDILDIRHYRQGRVEFEFQNQKVFHMRENEFCINTLANMPASYSFPFEKCSGVSLVIDRDSIDSSTIHQFSLYGIDIRNLGEHLELDIHWYICKTPENLHHIFDELYEAKGKESATYFRIKILELLYHVQKLRSEDRYAAVYYSKEHIEIVKRARKLLIGDLETKIPLESLIAGENISMVTFQAIFKQIYGDSPYTHLKKYKMNCAAVRLREGKESISEIAVSLGYSNASKFSKAFQDVFGLLPKDYRRRNNPFNFWAIFVKK